MANTIAPHLQGQAIGECGKVAFVLEKNRIEKIRRLLFHPNEALKTKNHILSHILHKNQLEKSTHIFRRKKRSNFVQWYSLKEHRPSDIIYKKT